MHHDEVGLHALQRVAQLVHELRVGGGGLAAIALALAAFGCPPGLAVLLAALPRQLTQVGQQVLRLAWPVVTCAAQQAPVSSW